MIAQCRCQAVMQLLGMMINAFYGGVGVGLLNYFIFIIIAVFHFRIDGRTNAGIHGT